MENYSVKTIKDNLNFFFKFFLLFFFINFACSLALSFSSFTILQGVLSISIIFFSIIYVILKIKINKYEKSLFLLITLFSVLFWIFLFYPALNANDDLKAYLFFQEKTATQGSLSIDPFSARRMYSLGGLYPFQGSLSHFDLAYLSIIEPGLGIALISLAIIFFSKNNLSIIFCLAILFLSPLLGSKILANTIGVYTLIFFTFLILHCQNNLVDDYIFFEKQSIFIIILSCILSLAIKPIPFVFNILILFYLFVYYLKNRRINIHLVSIIFISIILSLAYLYPFIKASYNSSGTLVYPFLGNGYRAPDYLSSQKFDTYNEINNILEFFYLIHLPLKDYFFNLTIILVIFFYFSNKRKPKILWILFSYVIFYLVILFTVGSDIVLVKRYTLPISLAIILFVTSCINMKFKISLIKKFLINIISIFVIIILLGSWILKKDFVNLNRKTIINSFNSQEFINDFNTVYSIINFDESILIDSKFTMNLYKMGYKNLVIFDAPMQVQPWFKNINSMKSSKTSNQQIVKNFNKYLKEQNIKFMIFDNQFNPDKNNSLGMFLNNNSTIFKLNLITVYKLVY